MYCERNGTDCQFPLAGIVRSSSLADFDGYLIGFFLFHASSWSCCLGLKEVSEDGGRFFPARFARAVL